MKYLKWNSLNRHLSWIVCALEIHPVFDQNQWIHIYVLVGKNWQSPYKQLNNEHRSIRRFFRFFSFDSFLWLRILIGEWMHEYHADHVWRNVFHIKSTRFSGSNTKASLIERNIGTEANNTKRKEELKKKKREKTIEKLVRPSTSDCEWLHRAKKFFFNCLMRMRGKK